MADNFNLRAFLSENKLTKNAQLLKEQESQHTPEEELYYKIVEQLDIAGLTGEVTVALHSTHGMPKPEFQVMNADDAAWMIAEAVVEAEADVDDILFAQGDEIDQQGELDPETEGLECGLEIAIVDVGTYEIYQGSNKGGEDNLDEGSYSDSYDTPAAKKVGGQLQSAIHDVRSRSEIDPTIDKLIAAAEQETQSQVTSSEKRILSSQGYHIYSNNAEMEREGTQNKKPMMKETKLTAKERRLVEMVNNAMGMKKENHLGYATHDEDQEFDPGHDIEQAQHDIERQYEGEDYGTNAVTGKPLPKPDPIVEDGMADETVIPEYNTIDELMNSIDHGTNEVAEKHKMEQMKKIAEALRMKAKKMEESEHAAHISPKDLKQLATDAAKLEKAAEKLKAAFDKKFNKKEKPASAAKAEKVEALQENRMENFDLKKFLVENKLTTNSRMVNEELKFIDATDPVRNKGGDQHLKLSDLVPGKTVIALNKHYSNKAELEDEAGTFIEVDENDYIHWKTKDGKDKVWKYFEDLAIIKNL